MVSWKPGLILMSDEMLTLMERADLLTDLIDRKVEESRTQARKIELMESQNRILARSIGQVEAKYAKRLQEAEEALLQMQAAKDAAENALRENVELKVRVRDLEKQLNDPLVRAMARGLCGGK